MYDIALSVAACVRSGTRVDVAWMVSEQPGEDGLAFTPGGGRLGGTAAGAFDGLLADIAARQLPRGRVLDHAVTELEQAQSGIAAGSLVRFVIAPGSAFPGDLWQRLMDRESVSLAVQVVGDEVVSIDYASTTDMENTISETTASDANRFVTQFASVPRLVVAGAGPIGQSLVAQGELLGWRVSTASRPEVVAGLTATLSAMDAIVVLGHDVESSGGCLLAALQSDAGYIGAVGSRAMQQARADWLAYRDVTDLDRVYGPAGLDIGAGSPAEVAVAIAAQIIAHQGPRG